MIKSFKYRLYPNKSQIKLINDQLFYACQLYNCAIEERKESYRIARKSINYYHQANQLKELRKDGMVKLANFSACQNILRRVDKTYRAFFNRIKRKQKNVGFPRYKSHKRFDTITYPSYGDGCKLKSNKVYLQGMGDIYIRLHRPVEGKIKTISVSRKNKKYYVSFSCDIENSPFQKTNKEIGVDMGLENFMVTSDGEFVDNPRFHKKSQDKLRVLQRSIARKTNKKSNSRKKSVMLLAKQYERVANQRRDFLHKLSNKIIKENDVICIEDLNIKGLAGGMLAKSVHDAGWGIFFNYLSYKAEYAGRTFIKVNPHGTSQRCNKCGKSVKKNLSDRWHSCVCGESCHRDFNSALEILRLGTDLATPRRDISPNLVAEAV